MNLQRMIFILTFMLSLLSVHLVHADSEGHAHITRADGHAPIGVMGEHTHKTGEWMLSYRYMRMEMDDHYSGTDEISDSEVLSQFMVAPTEMTMDMHMFGAMYAPSDDLTFMVMLPYIVKNMSHITRMGGKFDTKSEGIGDLKLSTIYSLEDLLEEKVLFNFGVSVPTGSVNQRDRTPMGADQKLPYPMQIGSGTVDILPGLTYLGYNDEWSWGAQARTTIRFGENSEDYRLGNRYGFTAWLAYSWWEWWSTSFRVDASFWNDIHGADPELVPTVVQTADPDNQGGQRVDLLFGTNIAIPKGSFKDHRFAFEFGFPVYQDLNGPQLGVEYMWTLAWQKAW